MLPAELKVAVEECRKALQEFEAEVAQSPSRASGEQTFKTFNRLQETAAEIERIKLAYLGQRRSRG